MRISAHDALRTTDVRNPFEPVDMGALIEQAREMFAARSMHGLCLGCAAPLGDGAHPNRRYCTETCRKAQYRKPCIDCAILLNGSAGQGPHAPRRCVRCTALFSATWTPELVLDRIREWADRFGRPPASTEWNRGMARQRGYNDVLAILNAEPGHWPHAGTVCDHFGTWGAAIRAAGHTPGRSGRAGRRPLVAA